MRAIEEVLVVVCSFFGPLTWVTQALEEFLILEEAPKLRFEGKLNVIFHVAQLEQGAAMKATLDLRRKRSLATLAVVVIHRDLEKIGIIIELKLQSYSKIKIIMRPDQTKKRTLGLHQLTET